MSGTLAFRPYYVQRGTGPHLLDWAYASDERWDAFHSDITASEVGVTISAANGVDRFGINVRWNVEGFGYLFLTADDGGAFYTLPPDGQIETRNLNFELAKSRVARNRRRVSRFTNEGWRPGREIDGYLSLSETYLDDAQRITGDEERRGALSQKVLYYALWASEMLELDYARFYIDQIGFRPDFFVGCDARAFYQMRTPEVFMDLFEQAFNYATITYVWEHDGVIGDFEPVEGQLNFEFRDAAFRRLRNAGIQVEGRPVVWFHTWVTPDWVKSKSYDELLKYVEEHTRAMVSHYGDEMYAWEIVNEFHDWANEVEVTPEQAVELTKLACDVAADARPNVHRLINNCCPFAEYVQLRQWSGQPAKYPQRTPWQFTRDLVDAGVDFTLIGQQMYFPYRDLQDTILLVERYEGFGKPLQLSEVGCPGGPTERSVKLRTVGFSDEPYLWHRYWDEELQADWLESIYTLAYSKPWIEACNWFDFVDPHSYLDNGGLIRSPEGKPKAAFERLVAMQQEWKTR